MLRVCAVMSELRQPAMDRLEPTQGRRMGTHVLAGPDEASELMPVAEIIP